MRENSFITKSIRKASSLKRYDVRVKKDTCLYDDAEHFITHHSQSVSRLAEKLLNNDFTAERSYETDYPL